MQRRADQQLEEVLRQASNTAGERIEQLAGRSNISARVEAAQLITARAEINRILVVLWDTIGLITKNNQTRASALATEVGWQWDLPLLRRAFPDPEQRNAMRNSLEQTASRNVEAAIARMTGRVVPLSARVYRSRDLSLGLVSAKISSALARGQNYGQLAAEVRDSIRPDTPGGVAYAAKRLARTEINAAYHAVTVNQNKDKPWNTGMDWHTSRSHSIPDICNLYADRSPYPLGEVPSKPHPQCMCWTTPKTVSQEDFLKAWQAGAYDSYINENYGRITKRIA